MFSRLLRLSFDIYSLACQKMFSIFFAAEKERLQKEVSDLQAQLQCLEERVKSQGPAVVELSAKLRLEMDEYKTLWDQVEYLTNEVEVEKMKKKNESDLLQKVRDMCLGDEHERMRRLQELALEGDHVAAEGPTQPFPKEQANGNEEERRWNEVFVELMEAESQLSYQKGLEEVLALKEQELRKEEAQNDIIQWVLEKELEFAADYKKELQRLCNSNNEGISHG